MGNRKTFNDFVEESPQPNDYVIGYSNPVPNGERRYKIANIKDFVQATEVIKLHGTRELEDNNIHGKIIHIHDEVVDGIDVAITLPKNPEMFMKFSIVNMIDHKSVAIKSNSGVINSRGNLLRKKYDTAFFYWDGIAWNGYGDLIDHGGMLIKTISDDYTFERKDADCIMHIKSEYPINITLQDPSSLNLISGTQFYIYNLSNVHVVLTTEGDTELNARSNVLRRKYDDVVVYTDGISWFATGDLT